MKVKREGEILKYKSNHIAFMDDTNIIGKNKKEIEELYEICSRFFRLCDIKANEKNTNY